MSEPLCHVQIQGPERKLTPLEIQEILRIITEEFRLYLDAVTLVGGLAHQVADMGCKGCVAKIDQPLYYAITVTNDQISATTKDDWKLLRENFK